VPIAKYADPRLAGSKTCTTFGCCKRATAAASVRKRSRCGQRVRPAAIILTATSSIENSSAWPGRRRPCRRGPAPEQLVAGQFDRLLASSSVPSARVEAAVGADAEHSSSIDSMA